MRRHLSEFARRRRSVVRCWWFTEHHVVRAASATRSGRAWWPWWCSLCGQAARCASPAAEKSTEKHWMLCYWVPHGLPIWLNGVCFFGFRIRFTIRSLSTVLGTIHKRRRQFFPDFWHPPPPCRQFFSTIRRQFWPIFDPSSTPNWPRRLWTAPNDKTQFTFALKVKHMLQDKRVSFLISHSKSVQCLCRYIDRNFIAECDGWIRNPIVRDWAQIHFCLLTWSNRWCIRIFCTP